MEPAPSLARSFPSASFRISPGPSAPRLSSTRPLPASVARLAVALSALQREHYFYFSAITLEGDTNLSIYHGPTGGRPVHGGGVDHSISTLAQIVKKQKSAIIAAPTILSAV